MNLMSKIITGLLCSAISMGAFAGVDYDKKEIKSYLTSEPPDLNGMKATDQVSIQILGHVMEGLTTYDKRGKITPGVAESWNIDDKKAVFKLRKNAKWSDGKVVTANDFVFAWRNVVDPKTASQYAFIMYNLKNAEKINQGKADIKTLGVKAVDDYTLEVEFEKPTPYFTSLTAFVTYYPAREDIVKKHGEKYAAEYNTAIYNGPFKITKWVHGASLKLEKNSNYWNAKKVKINVIDFPYVTSDPNAIFNLFKDNKIAHASLNSETIKDALKQKLKLKKFSDGSVFYIEFNYRDSRVTRNKNFRKAIQAVWNPKELVDKIIALPGNLPAYSLFPVWLKGENATFRKEYPAKKVSLDTKKAKEYLELAKKELGIKEFKPIVLLIGDSDTARKQAEYMQDLLKKRLGLDVKLDIQTFKQRLAKMTTGEFDMVAAGWGPDFDDPMTFADLFASWNENNRGKYKSAEYDKYVKVAQKSNDLKERLNAFAKLQELIVDDVVILPQYERGIIYVQNNELKGMVRNVIGADPNFIHASVKKPKK